MNPKEMQPEHKISVLVNKLDFNSEIRVVRDEYLLIDLIVVNEKIVNFPKNVSVSIVYFDEGEKLYVWNDVQIVPVKFKDGNKYHKISMPIEEGKKYNRRRHFRLYIGEEMRVDLMKGMEKLSIMPIIKDISASGFCFIYQEELDIGHRVKLFFEVEGEKKPVEFSGKVVRIQHNENLNSNMYGCSIFDPAGTLGKIINEIQQKKLSEKNSSMDRNRNQDE
jgi:c-di-GMP-binding flagellar brake protein YcgR